MGLESLSKKIVYLDNAATTPCDPRVIEAMMPCWNENFGNPSSSHVFGQLALRVIEDCRVVVTSALRGSGAVLFTSGSTESNNLGIYSLLKYARERLGRQKVLCLSTEHKSVINSVTYFGQIMNLDVDWIPVTKDGVIDMNWFNAVMDDTVGAVIVQLANSETGVIQDIQRISAISHKFGAHCFSDITQGVGKINVNLDELGIDYASFTAHKFHGPKGIGALYVSPGLEVSPLVFGGGQEKGVRPGTENVPGIVGLAEALKISVDELEANSDHMFRLRNRLWEHLGVIGRVHWNGRGVALLPSHLNVTIQGVNAQDLMLRVRSVAFSAGSACNAANNSPSPVLLRMGMTKFEAEQTIRLTLSKFNTSEEVEQASRILIETISVLRP